MITFIGDRSTSIILITLFLRNTKQENSVQLKLEFLRNLTCNESIPPMKKLNRDHASFAPQKFENK